MGAFFIYSERVNDMYALAWVLFVISCFTLLVDVAGIYMESRIRDKWKCAANAVISSSVFTFFVVYLFS